jgi:hypothetical protein
VRSISNERCAQRVQRAVRILMQAARAAVSGEAEKARKKADRKKRAKKGEKEKEKNSNRKTPEEAIGMPTHFISPKAKAYKANPASA